MRAKTRLQHKVVTANGRLLPQTKKQELWAFRQCVLLRNEAEGVGRVCFLLRNDGKSYRHQPQKQGKKSDFSAHINLHLLSLSSPKIINVILCPKELHKLFLLIYSILWKLSFEHFFCRISTFRIVKLAPFENVFLVNYS